MMKIYSLLFCAIVVIGCTGSNGGGTAPAGSNDGSDPETIARRLVAERTGVAQEDVEFISIEAIEFSDSSLGCPQPDMAYVQVITPGYKAVATFETEDTAGTFDIRISGQHGFICDQRSKTVPKNTTRTR